jgi:ADP-heptose:LPS heptosyltransferase
VVPWPLQLVRIALGRLGPRAAPEAVFVALTKHIGDLVNAFAVVERLAQQGPVEFATGPDPYRLLARVNPHLARLHAPFVYRRRRPRQRGLIERLLRPFYRRVILLDIAERDWWHQGRHLMEIYAARCGVDPPDRGRVYLDAPHREAARRWLRSRGLEGPFIFVAQVIRRRRPLQSWPLASYHALYAALRRRTDHALVVGVTGADEPAVPAFCHALDGLDLLTVAAVIERARLFVGVDSGLTHVAAALGVPTVSVHLGYPPEVCRALGDSVVLVRQRHPFDDPARTPPEEVLAAVDRALAMVP